MKNFFSERLSFALLIITISFSLTVHSSDPLLKREVQSLDSIITTYYRAVSGSKGFKYNPDIDIFLHAPRAMITRFNETDDFQRHDLSKEQESLQEPYSEGFYELEINRITEQYGNIAHVWSTFEMRESQEAKAFMRGLNSISFYFKDDRWFISSWSTQYEGERKIPKKYLPEDHLTSQANVTP